ncbi:putative NADH oxidase [Lasiosphaeria ovina]|uniref:NADH oxidase n=1 Tax=Lasiosphaeria ovina TaxID=92902 RepID=A0AAE0KHN8_9PEZI|nr:putative NADH oxidase [Lasiosphaeria ovina]
MATRYPCRSDFDRSALGAPLPFSFSQRAAPNRFVKSAMTERMASWSASDKSARGIPGDELVALYGAWGAGGFGTVITGNILIDHDHIEAAGNMIVPVDAALAAGPRFDGFQRLAAATREKNGALCIGQLNHPGRQCLASIQPDPVSASDVQLTTTMFGAGFAKPHPASPAELRAITAAFVHAAVFLEGAGFDGVQLHAAHGYLLAQFLSATTNRRSDAYGCGSLADRARLVTDIAAGIRAATRPGFVLGIKINSVEWQAGGLAPAEAADLCALLEAHAFDFVELSGGTYEDMGLRHRRPSTRAREAFFLDFAEAIAPRLARTRAVVTGGLRSAAAMADALRAVDAVGLGRPACSEPGLPGDILSGRVDACVRPLGLDDNDFGVTATLAAAQMRLVGSGLRTLDPSDEGDIAVFNESVEARASGGSRRDLLDHLLERLKGHATAKSQLHESAAVAL